MRKPLNLLTIATVVVVLGALTAASYAGGTGTAAKPRLAVVSWHPFTVQGQHFRPHSHVTVTLVSSSQRVKHVTVNSQGRFKVTFASAPADPCTHWSVRATQPGHAPVIVRGPKPVCPVPTA